MFLTDALGSLVATTDSAGGVQSELTYEPFGNTEISAPAPAYRFTGREDDEPLYLYYYRARYYHTDLQRFISEDPIGFGGGDVNLYGYVANSPVNFIDPLGLDRTSGQRNQAACGVIPELPPGADLRGNISEMEHRTRLNPANWFWFKRQVQNKGPWDYKQEGVAEANMFWGNKWNRYWAGGNFHYGATAAAFGVPDQVILRMAGIAAWRDNTSPPNSNWVFASYGDEPWDQHWIQAGIDYYRCISRRR